jgi:hypothetical protein
MQCGNCECYLPADEWVFVRRGGPSGRCVEKLADIIRTSVAVFCSEKCKLQKQDAEHKTRQGY